MKVDAPLNVIIKNFISKESKANRKKNGLRLGKLKKMMPKDYYLGASIALIIVTIIFSCSYNYLVKASEEKSAIFINGSELSIKNIMLHDFKLFFNKSSNLNQSFFLKNYTHVNNREVEDKNIVGTTMYIKRGSTTLIVDLQPLVALLNNVLANDYLYKVSIKNNILATNTEESIFSIIKKYKIDGENDLVIYLYPKSDSIFQQSNLRILKNQIITLAVGCIFLFFVLTSVLIRHIRVISKSNMLKNKISLILKSWDLSNEYIKDCVNFIGNRTSNTLPLISYEEESKIEINSLVEEIETHVYGFIERYNVKLELRINACTKNISIKYDILTLRQLIISLVYNVLHFMRGGTHTKQLYIEFNDDRVTIIYDSFAANERHMCNWSRDIFQHLGNPYILDCESIFQLIRDYKLKYEIKPKQGKNEIIVILNKDEIKGNVIKFIKAK